MNNYRIFQIKIKNILLTYRTKWSNEEEILLLEELNNNIDIQIIAQKHGRTIEVLIQDGDKIAYKMYLKNISIRNKKTNQIRILLY